MPAQCPGYPLFACTSGIVGCLWEPSDVFTCNYCGGTYCYCQGCLDSTPGLCDGCSNFIQGLWEESSATSFS